MKVHEQIAAYISCQSEQKRIDLEELQRLVYQMILEGKLWFLDGKDKTGKTISIPNIGYGCYTLKYADGTNKEFYQIGLSANTMGISVYIMGQKDKTYLPETYGKNNWQSSSNLLLNKVQNLEGYKFRYT